MQDKQINSLAQHISHFLGKWFTTNAQAYPFRQKYDPYHIWISEIMLQQTQMQTVIPYFLRFIERFPSAVHLAQAEHEQITPFWSGLGYYSRMRNLHKAAQIVSSQYAGKVPQDYDQLIKLPGIGDYTANAILGIAFNQPFYVVDGNVKRVLSRWFDLQVDLSDNKWHERLKQFLTVHFSYHSAQTPQPRVLNQALMEYGARVCSPVPKCSACELKTRCLAFKNGTIEKNPWKSKQMQFQDLTIFALLVRDARGGIMTEKQPLLFPWTRELSSLPLIPSIQLPVKLQSTFFNQLEAELQKKLQRICRNLETSNHAQDVQALFDCYQEIVGEETINSTLKPEDDYLLVSNTQTVSHRITRFGITVRIFYFQTHNTKAWPTINELEEQGINQITRKIIRKFSQIKKNPSAPELTFKGL